MDADIRVAEVVTAQFLAIEHRVREDLGDAGREGWELDLIQPVIYNSATTGYLLLILRRPGG